MILGALSFFLPLIILVWIIIEVRKKSYIGILLGLFCMFSIFILGDYHARVRRSYQVGFYEASLSRMERYLKDGDTNKVFEAIHAYQLPLIASKLDRQKAVERMWRTLQGIDETNKGQPGAPANSHPR